MDRENISRVYLRNFQRTNFQVFLQQRNKVLQIRNCRKLEVYEENNFLKSEAILVGGILIERFSFLSVLVKGEVGVDLF